MLRVVGPEITVSALMDRTKTNPWGLFGGEQGDSGGILVKKKGETDFRTFSEVYGTVCPSKFTCIALKEGDEVMILSPGGGGYGSPAERSLEAVAEDVRQGLVSVQSAEKIYGYKDC